MTDGLVTGGDRPLEIKVETTPHDLTVSLMACLESAASSLGFESVRAFLDEVDLIRWSSTVTSNTLAQRTGPRLGLIVSRGHEDDLYGQGKEASVVFDSLVSQHNVIGLDPGSDEGAVMSALRGLLTEGIRRVVVSFAGAFPDGSAEQRIAHIVGEQYPDHYLGSVPVLAGSDILLRSDDMTRTFLALINSYVHASLANSLFRAEDLLKMDHGWRHNILIGHINGGVARIGKTKAVDTIESGPLFGTFAAARICAQAGIGKAIALDVGGTTAKASAVSGGQPVWLQEGHLFGIPLRCPLPLLRSIALGGGSVARVTGGELRLGPESMGAAPGPACYGLGGREATLTDALVTLGVVSPTRFLGGRRKLNVEAARNAIERNVSKPLGVTVEAAAQEILAKAHALIAGLVEEVSKEAGWNPADAVLLAYGGNGPLFAPGVCERLGIKDIRLFHLGAIFSAYGSAMSDVLHVYESAVAGGERRAAAQTVGEQLAEQAQTDLRGEGFDPAKATARWEVTTPGGQFAETGPLMDRQALGRLLKRCENGKAEFLRLVASYQVKRTEKLARSAAAAKGPSLVESRPSVLGAKGELPVHGWELLRGRTLSGAAIVDGGTFTWLVPAGWELKVDRQGDATLRSHRGA